MPALAKQSSKFDERKFFNHLRKHADRDHALLVLLRSIDKRASVEISHLIFRYLRPLENSLRAKRKERGNKIKKSQKAALDSMLEATRKYRELAAIEIPGRGSAIGDAPKCADGTLLLPYILESEAVRIALQLGKAKKIYNEKRFGLSAYHLWLVILEEFVSLCTEKELGKAQALQPGQTASLIAAGHVALGWQEDTAESRRNPELVSKAILNFRANEANEFICKGAKAFALWRFEQVRQSRFLLGIEI